MIICINYFLDIIFQSVLISIIIFLIIKIFFGNFISGLGKNFAEIATKKQLTQIESEVKVKFEQDLERFKNELNTNLSHDIEKLRFELGKKNISYTRIYERQFEAIIELYKKLQILSGVITQWTAKFRLIGENDNPEEIDKELLKAVDEAIIDFRNFFIINKIFFDNSFNEFIENLFKDIWDKVWEYGYKSNRLKDIKITHEYYIEYSKDINKISDDIENVLPKKINEVETKIKENLGIANDNIIK